MKAMTRVQIKRASRLRPDWTATDLYEYVKVLTDAAGAWSDVVTLQGVKDVYYSMSEHEMEMLL